MGRNTGVYAKDIMEKVKRKVEKDRNWKDTLKKSYERVVYFYTKDGDLDRAINLVAKEFRLSVEQVEDNCLVMEVIQDFK